MLRRVAYSFSLRLLLSFALGLLLSRLVGTRLLSLSSSLFSLLLLKLTRVTLGFLIASGRLGALPVCLLLASLVCLPRFLALIFNLELLISGVVGDTFHAHRFRQVLPKRRLPDVVADEN